MNTYEALEACVINVATRRAAAKASREAQEILRSQLAAASWVDAGGHAPTHAEAVLLLAAAAPVYDCGFGCERPLQRCGWHSREVAYGPAGQIWLRWSPSAGFGLARVCVDEIHADGSSATPIWRDGAPEVIQEPTAVAGAAKGCTRAYGPSDAVAYIGYGESSRGAWLDANGIILVATEVYQDWDGEWFTRAIPDWQGLKVGYYVPDQYAEEIRPIGRTTHPMLTAIFGG